MSSPAIPETKPGAAATATQPPAAPPVEMITVKIDGVPVSVPKTMPRITWGHEQNWVKAIKQEATASSPLEYAAQLTETMLLGVAALRAGQGRKVLYDGEKMQFTNAPDANQYLTREYRKGWEI